MAVILADVWGMFGGMFGGMLFDEDARAGRAAKGRAAILAELVKGPPRSNLLAGVGSCSRPFSSARWSFLRALEMAQWLSARSAS
jgi:hypothetical protein